MDEPTSGLDPIATSKIELLIAKLKEKFTIIIVTHSMEQAQRVSDETVFFYLGRIYEYGQTRRMFMSPKEKKTREYVSGKIG
jgi:phosphate transport system ATP-binding protein